MEIISEAFEADILDFCNAIEAAVFNLKHRIVERHDTTKEEAKPAASEKNFNLTYTQHTGIKLGEFQIADEKDNHSDNYMRALNILKQNNANISDRYHGKDYEFSYWLYDGKIFRQKYRG